MSSSAAAAAAAPATRSIICCWLCGFPIGDMNTGYFPGTKKRTGEGVGSPRGDGYWGKGVGEHIVEPLMGSAFVGVYRTSYGVLPEGGHEKEFLKREIRWAHRYCNMIKWDLHMVTFRDGTLSVRNGPDDDQDKLIRYLVKNLFAGGVRVGRPDSRIYLGPECQVMGTDNKNWRNLIAYFLDCMEGDDINKKLRAWIDNRIEAIRAILQDYCKVVNEHLTGVNIYESRLHASITEEGNKTAFRAYQQMKTVKCPSAECIERLRVHLNSPSYEDLRYLPTIEEADVPNDEIIDADAEERTNILRSIPPTPASQPIPRGQNPDLASQSRDDRADAVDEYCAEYGKQRPRTMIVGIASDGQQVYKLWGNYNDEESVESLIDEGKADIPDEEDGVFSRIFNLCKGAAATAVGAAATAVAAAASLLSPAVPATASLLSPAVPAASAASAASAAATAAGTRRRLSFSPINPHARAAPATAATAAAATAAAPVRTFSGRTVRLSERAAAAAAAAAAAGTPRYASSTISSRSKKRLPFGMGQKSAKKPRPSPKDSRRKTRKNSKKLRKTRRRR